MSKVVLKPEYKSTLIAYGKLGVPLGQREDLDDLAIMAQESGDKFLLGLFESPLPSVEELKKARLESKLVRPEAAEEKKDNEEAPPLNDHSVSGELNKRTKAK